MGSSIFWVLVGLLALYLAFCWIRNRFFPDNFDHLKRQAERIFSRDKPVDAKKNTKKTAAPPVQKNAVNDGEFTAEVEPTP
ncbi:MAG: hypothetical protein K2Z81_05565, partial [Cyanobacteria bacterium]|nr:hypothetical protein [Cyanobacteriota bacterium]